MVPRPADPRVRECSCYWPIGSSDLYNRIATCNRLAVPADRHIALSELLFAAYMLLGLISTLVFRAVRDALPHDPVAQERILGAAFTALACADVRTSNF